jgi:glycogen operon protein
MDYTGCGNTLNMLHPHSLRLMMDSLRYWVTEMHVDGFRFDLASALARELHEVDQLGAFFDTIYQDPTLATIKLIAEPWDLGEGGYQVGNFPLGWTEWNGMYRDTIRRFWKGDPSTCGETATRLAGSADLYESTRRRPSASINFITAHDGFTLRDLVSYNEKHNAANAEENRDGADHNDSWNCGVEGETSDREILELRLRQRRNLLATLLLSQGVPMLSGGDELSRTQLGNNNAYCQDSPLSWYPWMLDKEAREFLRFAQKLGQLRRKHPNLRRHSFAECDPMAGPGEQSLDWIRPDGRRMTESDWDHPTLRTFGFYLNGQALEIRNLAGDHQEDDDLVILFNIHHEAVEFILPLDLHREWETVIDTARPQLGDDGLVEWATDPVTLEPRSLILLRHAR